EPERVVGEEAAQFPGDGVAQPFRAVLGECLRVTAVDGHDVGGVLPELEGALRAGGAEVDAEREDLAVADQPGGRGDLGRGDEVEGAEFVVAAPAAPVADAFGECVEVGESCHGSVVLPSRERVQGRVAGAGPASSSARRAARLPPSTHSTWPVM